MKKPLLAIIVALSGIASPQVFAAAASAPDTSIINCVNNYTGSLSSKIENGYLIVELKALGYVKVVSLAEKLGISGTAENPINQVEFMIPADKCQVDKAQRRLSCLEHGVLFVFRAKDGTAYPVQAFYVEMNAGVLGLSTFETQVIRLNLEVNGKSNNDEMNFSAGQCSH